MNRFDDRLCSGMAWSTADVVAATRSRAEKLGRSPARLPTRHDIDEPDDLRRLPASLQVAT